MGNVLGGEDAAHGDGGRGFLVGTLAGDEVDVLLPAQLAEGGVVVGEVGQVVERGVEVDVLVPIAVGVVLEVVAAAHRDAAVEEIGAAEKGVGGVQRAEGGAGDDGLHAAGALRVDERRDLVAHVGVELLVADGLVPRVHVVVEPALAVDGIDREDLHLAAVDEGRDGVDDMEPLILEVIGGGGGKHQEREAVVAVDGDLHVLVKAGAVPLVDLAVHGSEQGAESVEQRVSKL